MNPALLALFLALPCPAAEMSVPRVPLLAAPLAAPKIDFASFGQGPRADSDAEVAAMGDALYRRYASALYAQIPVTLANQASSVPGAGAHVWTPEAGHQIVFMQPAPDSPAAVDADGRVFTSFGAPETVKVQHKMERVLTYVHEYAHAVFGESVGNLADRPEHTLYDPATEGFAVTVERMVMDGMLADRARIGLSGVDAADVAAMREARRRYLRRDDNLYAEGRLRVWRPIERTGGAPALLASLRADSLVKLKRQDPAYQLSLDDPAKTAAFLEGRAAPVPELLDTARRSTLARFFGLHLDRQQRYDLGEETFWYTQKWKNALTPQALFALVASSDRASRELSRWLARKARAGKLERLFEADGFAPEVRKRVAAIVRGAESLPWSKRDHADWRAAIGRWLLADPSGAPKAP